nr:DUF664 domain-containing protein [Micromonospora chokoriensis]
MRRADGDVAPAASACSALPRSPARPTAPGSDGWRPGPGTTPPPRPFDHRSGRGSGDRARRYLAVASRTGRFLAGLRPAADLDRVVDEGWDPPVTLGVGLVSVAEDDLQHVGQAGYLRGLLETG